ncbi:ATP synthase F1 subunit epsilon [Anthocerotibacter panamensis]|uniref:ATP synthase F1 subunit epsilon n=1 Tax=Anthocerotibacter panamensis TaxID=2857077 RepID=UPI001C402100|nr:ATP synthase F1 subunit epsilon [Anthocerotibacter panamensis]
MALKLKIIAPDKVVWDSDVDEVILPSQSGSLGILTNHAPLLTGLNIGVLQVRMQNQMLNIAIDKGFAEVENNIVTILVNQADRGDQIDLAKAQEARARAQKILETSQDKADLLTAQLNLQRANAQIRAAGG